MTSAASGGKKYSPGSSSAEASRAEAVEAVHADGCGVGGCLLSVELDGDAVAGGVGDRLERRRSSERFRVPERFVSAALLDERTEDVLPRRVDRA